MKALLPGMSLAASLWAFADVGSSQAQSHVSCDQSVSSWCGLSEEQAEFLRRTRRATEAYQHLPAAVADGFLEMGADAPAMGRHWVSFARLLDGEIDPARPEILMYAVVSGRESLVGIGFAYVADPEGEVAPPANPFDRDDWHLHSGRLDMESHRMDHVGGGLPGPASMGGGHQAGAGVSVLHGWIWVENPAGMLEPNNWALPYARLGLSRPKDATPEADRALSLASMGAEFLITRAELFAGQGLGPTGGWAPALHRAEAEVHAWWGARPEGPLTSGDVQWLTNLWRRLGLQGL